MAGGEPVQIALEDDATPLVRILGATLRRSARNPGAGVEDRGMHGVVALKSSVDPQAVTMRFDKGQRVRSSTAWRPTAASSSRPTSPR